jgi:hypothetical protein
VAWGRDAEFTERSRGGSQRSAVRIDLESTEGGANQGKSAREWPQGPGLTCFDLESARESPA